MASLRSMRVVAALTALTAGSVTAFAMGHDQSTTAQSPAAMAWEIRLAPIIHPGHELGLYRPAPTTPEIKIAPGAPGTATNGNGFDFGLDTPSTPPQPEIKIAPTCGSSCRFWGG